MIKKKIKLSEFANEIKGLSEKLPEELIKATKIGVVRSLPDLVEGSPVDTGQYASSWDFTETEKKIILGNHAPHAAIIERGARPFTPPLGPLLAWAKRVLRDSSQPPEYSENVWRLAVGTQKKISQFGMKPRHVLEKMIPQIIENIKAELRKL